MTQNNHSLFLSTEGKKPHNNFYRAAKFLKNFQNPYKIAPSVTFSEKAWFLASFVELLKYITRNYSVTFKKK